MLRRNRKQNRGRKPRRSQRSNQAGARGSRLDPPELVTTFSTGHRFRFISATANFSLPVTRAMLLNLYTMATTTTNQFRMITGIKLNRIRLWGTPPALGASTQSAVGVEWKGQQGPSTEHTDVSMGVRPAYVSTRPPIDASNRWWSISGSNESEVIVNITTAVGTIIDIDTSVRFADDEAAVAAENGTGAASTVGQVYWNYLDGFASKKFAPVGGVTTLP